jgi:CBS domain-containing protein
MTLSAVGSRHPVSCPRSATVADVARRMEESNVGCVVVVEGRLPVGIVTDRDLVLRVLRVARDPRGVPVERVMTLPVHTVPDDLSPIEAAARMRETGVRRLPIVDPDGALLGIVTLDDLLHHVGRTSAELCEVVEAFPVPRVGG